MLETSDDFNVSGTNIFADSYILTAIDPNGNALAIWEQSDGVPDGSTRKVYSRRYIAGQGWQAAVVVPGLLLGSSTSAVSGKLFLDAAGNATWIRPNFETRRYNPTTGWSATPFIPANSAGGSLADARMRANGDIAMLGVGGNTLYTTLAAGASSWTAWVNVSQTTQATGRSQLALSDDGTAMAIWAERNPGDTNDSLKASRLIATGWQAPVAIENLFTNLIDDAPRVAIDAAGNAVAMWAQGNSIYTNRFNASTGTWGTATALEAGQGSVFPPRIKLVMTPDGRAVATWTSTFAARSSQFTAAAGWSAPVELTPYNIDLSLGISSAGKAVVVYRSVDNYPNPTSATQNLYSRQLTFGGTWSAPALLETGAGEVKGDPVFDMNANGQAVAVWVQDDLPNNQIRNSLWSAILR